MVGRPRAGFPRGEVGLGQGSLGMGRPRARFPRGEVGLGQGSPG